MNKTFRLFISSTFSDFKAERHVLHKTVFPKLKLRCEKEGFRFQPIDLRWGVTTEAANDQQTMRICLEEVWRCQKTGLKPNFMILLGQRYGWRPVPPEIEAGEFERLLKKATDPEDLAALSTWYKCDFNAIPPKYCLQARLGKLASFADWQAWDAVERRLRGFFTRAVAQADLTQEAKIKYLASATEQEIVKGALEVSDAASHVFTFARTIAGLPETVAAKDFRDLLPDGSPDRDAEASLARLKRTLQERLKPGFFEYAADWRGETVSADHLETFAGDVETSLSGLMMKEIQARREISAGELERLSHAEFSRERARGFSGRAEALAAAEKFVRTDQERPLAVIGPSGSGKSAFMGRLAATLGPDWGDALVLTRFIGATPASTDIRVLLEGILEELESMSGLKAQPPAFEFKDLTKRFHLCLAEWPPQRRLIVLIDALDQLSESQRGKNLLWLPSETASQVRLIVSTLSGDETADHLESRLPSGNRIHLSPLNPAEGEVILETWLRDISRTLQEPQKKMVLEAFSRSGNPLHLKLMFEEFRHWTSFQEDFSIGSTIGEVIDQLLSRLTVRHGKMLTTRALGYLAASRFGLSEEELLDVLTLDPIYFSHFLFQSFHDLADPRVPVVLWSRMYGDLEPYLIERDMDGTGLLNFFHREFGQTVADRIFPEKDALQAHALLSEYYDSLTLYKESGTGKRVHIRKISELPFQLSFSRRWKDLEECLCRLDFIEAKCLANQIYDLVQDFERSIESMSGLGREFFDFVRSQTHVLKSHPALARQQARNQPVESGPSKVARAAESPAGAGFPLPIGGSLLWLNRPQFRHPCVMTWTGHTGGVKDCALSGDGKTAASAGEDGTLKLWDTASGYELMSLSVGGRGCRSCDFSPGAPLVAIGTEDGHVGVFHAGTGARNSWFGAHPSSVNSCRFSPSGSEILTSSDEGCLKLWQAGTGKPLGTLGPNQAEGASLRAFCGAFSPDGRSIAAGFSDRSIRLFETATLRETHRLKGHDGWVRCLDFSPDGKRILSGSTDGILFIWDIAQGLVIRKLTGHQDWVRTCFFSRSGTTAVSAGADLKIMLWDTESGEAVKFYSGHAERIHSIRLFPDQKTLLSASADGTLKIWNLLGQPDPSSCTSHSKLITSCRFSPCRSTGASASEDGSIMLWDSVGGNFRHRLSGHTGRVHDLAFSRDGSRLLSFGEDRKVILWETGTGKNVMTLEGHTAWVTAGTFSTDGKRAITGSTDCTLRIWDLASGKTIHTLTGHKDAVWNCLLSPNGETVMSASDDGNLKLWDVQTGSELRQLRGHRGRVRVAAFSPDGTRIISGGADRILKLWNAEAGNLMFDLTGHSSGILGCAFDPRGKTALSVSQDSTALVWDAARGNLLLKFARHEGPIASASFSPDGSLVASASIDGVLYVWTADRGDVVATWIGTGPLRGVNWNPDGTRLIVGEETGTVFLLALENFPEMVPVATALASPRTWWNPFAGSRKGFYCPHCAAWDSLSPPDLGKQRVCKFCEKKLFLNSEPVKTSFIPEP